MATITGNKRRHCEHTLDVKYAELIEIEEGLPTKMFPKSSMSQKHTLSTREKNRDKIVTAFKSSGGTKTQRIKEGT